MKYIVTDTELNIAIAQFDTPAEANTFKGSYGPGADTLDIVHA